MGSELPGPTDIDALQRQLAELQSKLAATQEAQAAGERGVSTGPNSGTVNTGTQTVTTQGGAAVQGSVQVANGHFIGRDFVHRVTNITQLGEDPDEAKSVIALYLHALVTPPRLARSRSCSSTSARVVLIVLLLPAFVFIVARDGTRRS